MSKMRLVLLAALAVSSVFALTPAHSKPVAAGPNCTTTDTTKNGKPAKCTICVETKCDTSGKEVTNCRKEKTTDCVIDEARRQQPPIKPKHSSKLQ